MNYMVIGIQICGFGSNKAGGYHFASSAITSMLLWIQMPVKRKQDYIYRYIILIKPAIQEIKIGM